MRALRVTARLALIAGLLTAAGTSHAQGQNGCLTNACHIKVKQLPHKHSAVVDGSCTDCHEATGETSSACGSKQRFQTAGDPAVCLACHSEPAEEGRHAAVEGGCLTCHAPHGGPDKANLKGTQASVCADCHDPVPATKGKHKPVADGRCTACHQPHASPNSKLLVRQDMASLCLDCHKLPLEGRMHMPLEEGCGTCHAPHGSANEGLLLMPQRELCAQCHDVTDPGAGRHRPVAEGDCSACHNPHAAKAKYFLRKEGNDLCLGCHGAESRGSLRKVSLEGDVHPVLLDGCVTCHVPHGSAHAKLLTAAPARLCYECHETFKGPYLHSAVKLGRCEGCHDPHASKEKKLLLATGAALCFECHADDVTGRESVHGPVAEGECLTCHEPHQSKNPAILVTQGINETCANCHDVDLGAKVVHGAIERSGCTGCHDPHGSNEKQLLVTGPQPLCSSCHPDQADGKHVFTNFAGKPHPIGGVSDPRDRDRDLSCASCHLPHSGPNPKLWPQGETKTEACQTCHPDYKSAAPSVVKKPGPPNPQAGAAPAVLGPAQPTAKTQAEEEAPTARRPPSMPVPDVAQTAPSVPPRSRDENSE